MLPTMRSKSFLTLFLWLILPALAGAQPVRGAAGDLWADLVLGQPNFGSLSFNQVTASSVFLPSGMAADPNPAHHRLYVWDAGNSRVLGYSDTSLFQSNTAAVSLGYAADIVIGQADFTHGGSNGDNNDQLWPAYTAPSQSSVAGMWQRQGSILEGGSGSAMAVDPATGDLYVADVFNSRVLRFAYGDLAPGAAGVAASGVWGQPDYTSFLLNQGLSSPTNSTLAFGGPQMASLPTQDTNPWGGDYGGVGFDSQHNLWVADTANNRVLRFPAGGGGLPQTTADLVLGQSNFNATATTNMTDPLGVRVDTNGNVYVMDFTGGGRILIYNAVSLSGQTAVAAPDLTYTANLSAPWAIDMDGANHLWVTNQTGGYGNNGSVVEFQPQTNAAGSVTNLKPINALMRDSVPPAAVGGSITESGPDFSYAWGGPAASAFVQNPQYAVVDGNGNVYVSTKGGVENVFRFPGPVPTPHAGWAYSADVEVFKQSEPGMWNQIGWNGINVAYGVAVAQDNPTPQLIVSDSYRLDYWNLPAGGLQPGQSAITNGQAPDGYAGVNSTSVTLPGAGTGTGYFRMRVDHSTGATGSQHLWVSANQYWAQYYNLPLTNYASAAGTVFTNIPVLGAPASLVDWTGVGGLSGLNDLLPQGSVSAPYASGPVSYLWVADNYRGRVFRIRDPMGQLGLGPVVDILIGQTTVANNKCANFGTYSGGTCTGSVPENQKTLNWPGSVALDHAGNLYICDFSLETAGNWRLLEFDEAEIAQASQASVSLNTIQFISSVSYTGANHVYFQNGSFTTSCLESPPVSNPVADICMPLQVAFPSDDRALVGEGFERMAAVIPHPQSNFDPTNPADPWAHLNDFYSNLYSLTFDEQDNLYTVDSNRARVLVYYNPIATVSPTPTATLSLTPTATATMTPTSTPTDTPSFTPTPTTTLSPTVTATFTPTLTTTNTTTFTPTFTPTASPTVTPTSTVTATPTERCHEPAFYPNPCPGSLHLHFSPCDEGREVHVKIFTVVDRKVLDKDFAQVPVGVDVALELKDNWGTPLANGLYYLVLDGPRGRTIGKLLVLR